MQVHLCSGLLSCVMVLGVVRMGNTILVLLLVSKVSGHLLVEGVWVTVMMLAVSLELLLVLLALVLRVQAVSTKLVVLLMLLLLLVVLLFFFFFFFFESIFVRLGERCPI